MIGEPAVPTDVRLTEDQWKALEHDPAFQALFAAKMRFIIPAMIVFVVYYFGFLILVGYFPTLMETNVVGHINIAYIAALSQFAMAWIITYFYAQRAKSWDEQAEAVIAKFKGGAR
jgi:uncharacterized membrane protein (DUF485 family)